MDDPAGCLSWCSLLVGSSNLFNSLFLGAESFLSLVQCHLISVAFFSVSAILWFVSCGLLTVSWALSVGLLGNHNSLFCSSLFICSNFDVFLMKLSLSQPHLFMQASELLTWKLVWTHSVKNSELSGAIIVSSSFWRLLHVSYWPFHLYCWSYCYFGWSKE